MYFEWLKSFKNIQEYPKPIPLNVRKGHIPQSIRGTYYKNGPGRFEEYGTRVIHPFDGDGYISAFRFENGSVSYQSRLVQTHHRIHEQQRQKRLYSGVFGTPPSYTWLKNTANTNVVCWGKHLIAFQESGIPYILDPVTLETLDTLPNFHSGIPYQNGNSWVDTLLKNTGLVGQSVCAHPKIMEDRMILYTLGYNNKETCITFFELDKDFKIMSQNDFVIPGFLYIHDFVVSQTHYLFFKHSIHFDYTKMKDGVVNCINQDKRSPTLLYALPRPVLKLSRPVVVETLPGFITHHAGVSTPMPLSFKYSIYSILYPNGFRFDKMMTQQHGLLYKTEWDVLNGDLFQKRLTNKPMEFPCMDEYGNIYGILANRLMKYSPNGQMDTWNTGSYSFLGEPMLLNDDYIICTCYDSKKDSSTLLIWDIHEFMVGPVVEIDLPEAVPVGLHGFWHKDIFV
jgi:all-trans-8'-apo-beta-carotenal 15,15'-oxygenase